MQGKFAHNSIGGAASPFWINSCTPAKSSHCRSLPCLLPASFSCLVACVLTIDPVSHRPNIISPAKRWLAAQCCPLLLTCRECTCWYRVPGYWLVLFSAPPWPLGVSEQVKEREGDMSWALHVTEISLDFVDADQRWQERRTAEIGSAVKGHKTQTLKPISFERIFKANAMVDQSQYRWISGTGWHGFAGRTPDRLESSTVSIVWYKPSCNCT